MYRHKPLVPGKTIRILILEPALKRSHPVSCKLQELCLDGLNQEDSPYEALSYVWGSPKGDDELLCNGQPLLVTENCLVALRYLRYRWRPRTLWIDAICIDQSSTEERNHQVQLMGDVYRLARCVLIWLGVGTRLTGRMMRHLRWKKKHSDLEWKHRRMSRLIGFFLDSFMTEEMKADSQPDYFQDALPVDWYTRVWCVSSNTLQQLAKIFRTLQELIMSRQCLIICGRHCMHWSTLYNWVSTGPYKVRAGPFMPISVTMSTHTAFENFRYDLLQKTPRPDWAKRERRSTYCLLLLSATRSRFASDPRDKVYGIYSNLMELGVAMPEPDYSKTVCDVYQEFIIAIIKHLETLEVLTHEPLEFNIPGWPSWVPNLECSINQDGTWTYPTGSNTGYHPDFQFECSAGQLSLKGIVYGRLNRVGTMCLDRSMEQGENLVEFVAWLLECYQMTGSLQRLQANQQTTVSQFMIDLRELSEASRKIDRTIIVETFLRALLTEFELEIDGRAVDLENIGLALHESVSKLEWKTIKELETLLTLVNKRPGRTPFVATSGHFGTGCYDIAVNDMLVRLYGATVPMIIRPDGNNYRLIGTAHIYHLSEHGLDGTKKLITLV